MKLLKKILWLGAILATCLGFSLATTSCNDGGQNSTSSSSSSSESDSVDDNKFAYVYRVSVQNMTGFGFKGATITLMDGDTVVATKKTNNSGNANFLEEEIAKVGNYKIVVSDIPEGYALPETAQMTAAQAGTTTVVRITPTGVLQGTPAAGTRYELGDVVYDFSITLADNTTYTLSHILEDKDMVLLNFWATTCGPCLAEFPYMHNAAKLYEDSVSVLAIALWGESKQVVAQFQNNNAYDAFNMAESGSGGIAALFGFGAEAPVSVVIDRYGVVSYIEAGGMPSTSAFSMLFDRFVGEEYVPTVVGSLTDEDIGGDEGGTEQMKPNVAPPEISDLKNAFTTDSAKDFSFNFQAEAGLAPDDDEYDEYNWPWLVGEDGTYIYPANKGWHSSYAILYSTVNVQGGDAILFDYKIATEKNCDVFYIILDGVVIKSYSGYGGDKWKTSYCYVFKDFEEGEHSLSFVFLKDSSTTEGDDVVYVKDLRVVPVESLEDVEEEISIFLYAATQKNEEENATTQYARYITPVYNDKDKYYHVGSENGPVLYADLMNATLWNETSLWLLAYYDYVIDENGNNYHYAIEDFAWECTQLTTVTDYTPVTEDLKELLDIAVKSVSYAQRWEGDYHENEWLELCVYWEHYGKSEMPKDPMAGITFTAAIEMFVGDNEVNVPFAMNPRGFKYKFIPEEDGIYKVYSTGEADSFVFLFASDRETILGTWDNKVLADSENDRNFEFMWNFKAGETYYLLFTTYMDEAAKYNVTIEFLGTTYNYFTNISRGEYSQNLTTGELYLPDAIDYAYNEETNCYHHVNEKGEFGSKIYLDLINPLAVSYFGSLSLYQVCKQAIDNEIAPEKRALYVDGEDYTDEIYSFYLQATDKEKTDPLYGYIEVSQTVYDVLQSILLSEKYDGIQDTWLALCYYYKPLGVTE